MSCELLKSRKYGVAPVRTVEPLKTIRATLYEPNRAQIREFLLDRPQRKTAVARQLADVELARRIEKQAAK